MPILVISLLLSAVAWACGPSIRSVEIRGTERPLELETRAGQTLDPASVTRDVRRLWATGWFEEARVECIETPAGSSLVFRLADKPRLYLRQVQFDPSGARRPVKIEPGTLMDFQRAQHVAAALQAQLSADGYTHGKVEAKLLRTGVRQVDLWLSVETGRRYRVQEVRFSGDLGMTPAALQKALHATRVRRVLPGLGGLWKGWKLRPVLSDAALESDLERLRSLYLSRGYFDAQVRLHKVEYVKNNAMATISVQSGPHFGVRQMGLSGAREGQPLSPGAGGRFPVRELCQCLLDSRREAEKQGQLDFDVRLEAEEESRAAPRVDKWVNLRATIETGPPFTVGRIEFRGNHSYSDRTLRRAMVLEEGALFDPDRLLRSLARLNQTGLFEPVTTGDVAVARDSSAHRADITIWLHQPRHGRWLLSGPVGPPHLAGPLQALVASRLPAGGEGILESSTYFATLSVTAFANPLWRFLPFAPALRFRPLFALERPYLPGQEWQSGFLVAPQLGLKGMLASYGIAQLHRGARAALKADVPSARPLIIPVERVAGENKDWPRKSAGFLMCEPRKSRWAGLRSAGTVATDWLLAGRPF